ncbi:MAG: FHA domain-containing protein [Gomphosphaeria aponina SAG 52.96 = DSM 107014]|uniref:FHA domain-containing protein n=1 Tax=Gomphosphaeria aponina SAG 52.96 = DSM 107014 TaxID=1521640 RepID=A0A941GYY3_9CHRO|nr:FHA domain-containing protein [Gomphosphaeria aponina SAG 52.96 = DSM 107014]
MIVCPKCKHQNPDGATQCEACLEPLPTTTNCPNCGAIVQTDATFCGQCGYNLQPQAEVEEEIPEALEIPEIPATIVTESATLAGKTSETKERQIPSLEKVSMPTTVSPPPPQTEIAATTPASEEVANLIASVLNKENESEPVAPFSTRSQSLPDLEAEEEEEGVKSEATVVTGQATQLQVITAKLLHVQTNKTIDLQQNLSIIHIGKPNEQVPPDIDVSGFPNSDVVSRIHADIRVEGGTYFIEDVGSTNGTYVNHAPLAIGNRHKLRAGDRIALGKEDKVTFIFQMS